MHFSVNPNKMCVFSCNFLSLRALKNTRKVQFLTLIMEMFTVFSMGIKNGFNSRANHCTLFTNRILPIIHTALHSEMKETHACHKIDAFAFDGDDKVYMCSF